MRDPRDYIDWIVAAVVKEARRADFGDLMMWWVGIATVGCAAVLIYQIVRETGWFLPAVLIGVFGPPFAIWWWAKKGRP